MVPYFACIVPPSKFETNLPISFDPYLFISHLFPIQYNEDYLETRKQSGEILQQQSQQEGTYRKIFQSTGDSLAILSLEGGIVDVNPAATRLFGYPREEFLNMHPRDVLLPQDRHIYEEFMSRALAEGDLRDQTEIVCKDGIRKHIEVRLTPVEFQDRTHVLAIIRDITERVKAEQALRESRQLLQRTFASLSDAVFVISPGDRSIRASNQVVEEIFGYTQSEVRGRNTAFLHVDQESYRRFDKLSLPALNREGKYQGRFQMRRKDGSVFPSEHTVTEFLDAQGQRAGVVSVVRDISDRVQREERLRQLTDQLVRAQEDERRRIARELHDELGQALTAISLDLAGIDRGLPADVPTALLDRLEEARALVNEIDDRVNEIALNLRPSLLDDLGLIPALRWYTGRFSERTGTTILTHFQEIGSRLRDELATAIYRIVQESLTNVARHAGASRVKLALLISDHTIELSIEDNGSGFDAYRVNNGSTLPGIGLIGIQERIHNLGGSLKIHSCADQGTKVTIRLPLQSGS